MKIRFGREKINPRRAFPRTVMLFWVALAIWLVCLAPRAHACKCTAASAKEDYRRASLVMIGELKFKPDTRKLEEKPVKSPLHFRVKSVLKGKTGDVNDLWIKRAQDVPMQCQSFVGQAEGIFLLFLRGSAGRVGFTLLSDCYVSQYPIDENGMVALERWYPAKKTKLEDLKAVLSSPHP